jgi:hypothetical protein
MRKPSVDLIAMILALTLGIATVLVIASVIVQIVITSNNSPVSGTSAQVIDSVLTGIIGVLGSYVGYSMRKPKSDEQQEGED